MEYSTEMNLNWNYSWDAVIQIIWKFVALMSESLERCDNCQKEFPESKMATHFGYCRRNIKRCSQCGEMYDINCQQEHEQEFHKKANCQFCKQQFGVGELDKHKNICTQRTKYCEYCELNVPFNQYSIHLKACQSRTKGCDKCKKPIPNRDYLVHLTTCRGIEEPRNYEQFINNQRLRDPREQIRQPARKVQYQPEQRKQPEYRRRQVPSNGGISNYVGSKDKPSVPSVQVPSRSQPTSIPSNYGASGNNKVPVYNYVPSTSNPREGNQTKEPTRGGNYAPPNRNEIKTEVRTDSRRNDQNTNNYGQSYQPNIYKPADNIKKQTPIVTKPVVSPISNTGHGPKTEAPKPPSYTSNQIKKQPVMKKQERAPVFDPHEYGGYSDQIPQELLRHDFRDAGRNIDPYEEDEQLQKVLIESINQTKKSMPKNIPKQLSNEQLMNSSFYQDIDEAKQRAAYQQMQRNAKKNNRR